MNFLSHKKKRIPAKDRLFEYSLYLFFSLLIIGTLYPYGLFLSLHLAILIMLRMEKCCSCLLAGLLKATRHCCPIVRFGVVMEIQSYIHYLAPYFNYL